MDFQIDEISSTVRMTDSQVNSQHLVRLVINALAEMNRLQKDAREERRVGTGVRDRMENDRWEGEA
jgi:hypothetical protein